MTIMHDRRSFVLLAGGALVASTAGCIGDDDDDNDGNDVDGFAIDPGTTIVFDGYIEHWLGQEPSEIADEENPTLILEAGGEYEMEWVNADGSVHNLEIRDADREVVDDLFTEDVGEVGEGDSLSFTASEEMTTYVCKFHETTQIGSLVVE